MDKITFFFRTLALKDRDGLPFGWHFNIVPNGPLLN